MCARGSRFVLVRCGSLSRIRSVAVSGFGIQCFRIGISLALYGTFVFHKFMLESDASQPAPKWSNLRVLSEFARPHLPSLLLGLVLALCGSAATLATPMVTKWVLDTLDTGASLKGPILTLVVLLIVGAVLGCAQWIVLGTAAEKVVFDARSSLVKRFLAATVPSLQSRSVGELVTRVTSDTLLLREAASSAAVNILNAAALTIGTIVLMGVLDLPLLGVTMVAIVFASILFAVLMPRISAAEARTQESLGQLGGVLEGGLRAIRTVKVSLAEDRVGALVTNNASDAKKSMRSRRCECRQPRGLSRGPPFKDRSLPSWASVPGESPTAKWQSRRSSRFFCSTPSP